MSERFDPVVALTGARAARPDDMSPGAGANGHAPRDSRGRFARFLDAAVAGDEDPSALGLCRIALVTVFTLSLVSHIGAVDEYFSAASMVGGSFAKQAFHSRLSLFLWFDDPLAVRAIFGLGVVAHLLWLVGLYTRPAALVAFAVWASMVGRNPLLYAMPDQLHTCLMLWLALTPSGRGLSLDARWRGKGGPVPVWCRRLLHLQIAVMYTSTGLLKSGATWKADGTAIYYSLVNPYNRHFDITRELAAVQPYVLRPATWLVLVWEVGFAAFVLLLWLRESTGRRWFPDLRRAWLGFGALMHLSIWALMYVVWFTPLVLAGYFAFLRPDEARRVVDRVAARVRRSPA